MGDPKVNFKIQTLSDLKALADYRDKLDQQIKAEKEAGKSADHLSAKLRKVDKAIQNAPVGVKFQKLKEHLQEMNIAGGRAISTIEGLVSLIRSPLAAAVAVVASLAAAFKLAADSVSAYAAQEEQITRLDAALAQNGLFVERIRREYQELAAELQEATAIADDKWYGVLAKLTQLGSRPESIGMDVEAVKNLAGILSGDESSLEQAALAIGLALRGNFGVFQEYGILLDENSSKAEKLSELYKKLADIGGGQLEAASDTLSKRWGQVKNNAGDLLEAIGGLIVKAGVLQVVLVGLADSFKFFADLLGETVPPVDNLSNSLNRNRREMEQDEAAAQRFAEALQEIRDEAQHTRDELSGLTRELRKLQRLQAELESKQKALAFAQVDALEDRGMISPTDAARRRVVIEEHFKRQQRQREAAMSAAQMETLNDALTQAQSRARDLEARTGRKREEYEAAKDSASRQEDLDAAGTRYISDREGYNRAHSNAAFRRQAAALLALFGPAGRAMSSAVNQQSQKAYKEAQQAEEDMRMSRRNLDSQRRTTTYEDPREGEKKRELEALQEQLAAAKREMESLSNERETLSRQTELEQSFNRLGDILENTARRLEANTELRQAGEVPLPLRDPGQEAVAQSAVQQAQGAINSTNGVVVGLLQGLINDQQETQQRLDLLNRQFQNMRNRRQ